MPKLSIDIPETFEFFVELPVYISHINRGDHLGNDSMVSFLNEARLQFMAAYGVEEYKEQGHLFVNADLAVIYKSEGRYGDVLKVEVAVSGFHKYGCDIVYRISALDSGRVIAYARTSHVMFDPDTGKPSLAPVSLREKLLKSSPGHS